MVRVIVYDSICLHFGKVSADMERYGKTTANATEDRWFIEDLCAMCVSHQRGIKFCVNLRAHEHARYVCVEQSQVLESA